MTFEPVAGIVIGAPMRALRPLRRDHAATAIDLAQPLEGCFMMKCIIKCIIVLALLSLHPVAHAQQIYKCPGKDGVPSYQSDPCTNGQASKTWDASQPHVSPADQARIDRQRHEALISRHQRSVAANAPVNVVHPGPTESQQRQSRCSAARRERDACSVACVVRTMTCDAGISTCATGASNRNRCK